MNLKKKKKKKTLFIKSYYHYLTTEDIKDLRNIFKKYGALKTINISSKGFGFVEFYVKNSASTAINNKDKILFKQKKLRIEYAKDKKIKWENHQNQKRKKDLKNGESLEQTGISGGFDNHAESRNNTLAKENQKQNTFLEQKRRREKPKEK